MRKKKKQDKNVKHFIHLEKNSDASVKWNKQGRILLKTFLYTFLKMECF